LRRTISLGISKVNVGTELNTTIVEWMREQWRTEEYLWMPELLVGSMQVAAKVVEKWFRMTGAAGRA
jgi:fructose/tagatose bisphosphate aldolase